MPRVIHETIEQVSWEDIHLRTLSPTPKPAPRRTPGLHLSGIIRHIAISGRYLKGVDPVTGKWVGDTDADLMEEDMPLRMALGMAWEEWVATLYPEMRWQPGELSMDGIIGSPDGLTVSDPSFLPFLPEWTPIIEEFKCTWKSSRNHILDKKTLIWIWQGGCYAHMYGCNHVRFNVLWVNGDYDRGGVGGPIYKRYLVEYTPAELQNIWKMILLNKNAAGVKIEQERTR